VEIVLLARLSVALTLRRSGQRRSLADEAVAVARRAGDSAALAYALSAWCDCRAGPSDLSSRLAASEEMLGAASRSGDPELELLARRFRITALLEQGDVADATRHIEAFVLLADRLRQPQFTWFARLMEGMLAHLTAISTPPSRWPIAFADGRAPAAPTPTCSLKVVSAPSSSATGARREPPPVPAANNIHPEAERGLDSAPLFLVDLDGYLDPPGDFCASAARRPTHRRARRIFLQVVTLYACGADR
jgi:hypothetical protein